MSKKILGRKAYEITLNPELSNPKICRVLQNGEACVRKAGTSGLCRKHLDWASLHQRLDLSLTGLKPQACKISVRSDAFPPEICRLAVDGVGCDAPASYRGLCSDHYAWARTSRRMTALEDRDWASPGMEIVRHREQVHRSTKLDRNLLQREAAVKDSSFQILVTLCQIEPPVWRRFSIPSDFSLHALHWSIQTSFEWENQHLYQLQPPFERSRSPWRQERTTLYQLPYVDNDDEASEQFELTHDNLRPKVRPVPEKDLFVEFIDSRNIAIAAAFEKEGSQLRYTYDLGDCWEHEVVLEKILPQEPPKFLKGSGKALIEDADEDEVFYRPYKAAAVSTAFDRLFKSVALPPPSGASDDSLDT